MARSAKRRPYAHMGRLGWAELKTYGRQGLAELRGLFYGESRIAQPPDPGMPGMYSQGEAAQVRRSAEPTAWGRDEAGAFSLDKYNQMQTREGDERAATHERDGLNREDVEIERE